MKIERTILAVIGLAAIALAYLTGNFYFLILAVVVFFAGIYVMGAAKRSGKGGSGTPTTKGSRKDRKQD
jgi:CDP-diglyceride synthetase